MQKRLMPFWYCHFREILQSKQIQSFTKHVERCDELASAMHNKRVE
jgi:hypothetical protein